LLKTFSDAETAVSIRVTAVSFAIKYSQRFKAIFAAPPNLKDGIHIIRLFFISTQTHFSLKQFL
jgi:hypothetical protein